MKKFKMIFRLDIMYLTLWNQSISINKMKLDKRALKKLKEKSLKLVKK